MARKNEEESVVEFNLAVTLLRHRQHEAAVRIFRSLAKSSSFAVEASLELAKAQLFGLGTKRDVGGAIKKLRFVARSTRPVTQFSRETAMVMLADLHLHGWAVRRDYRAAVRWLRRAEAIGSASAQGLLIDLGERPSAAPAR